MNINPNIELIYKAGDRLPFGLKSQSIIDLVRDKASFNSYFKKFIERKKSYSPEERRLSKYERILKDEYVVEDIINYIKTNISSFDNRFKNEINISYQLDFSNSLTLNEFIRESDTFNALIDLELLKLDKIILTKNQSNFLIEHASSGEYHLLTSFLGIASKIEENSLIVIDEPEISLHPNWQMQYMDVLNQIFGNYPSCHFIIASHSHFIVSDLKESKSNIIALKQKNATGEIYSTDVIGNTYFKSAEEILLEVFETPTTRNYYVSELIGDIIQKMADPESDNNEIKSMIMTLKDLNLQQLSDNDPLKDVINKLLAKI